MTENEAIEILTEGKSWLSNDRNIDAFCLGIEALEEIQQYRELEKKLNGISVEQVVNGFIEQVEKGTAEGYERGRILTNKEADDWNKYRAIGTVEEFKALKAKAEPNKPIIKPWSDARCPSCNCSLSESLGDGYYQHFKSLNICDCGQKLDWT